MAVDINDTKDAEKLASEMLDLPDKVYSSGRRSSHSRRKSLMLNTPDISGKDSDSGSEVPSRRGSTSRRASTAHRRGSFLNIDGKDSGDSGDSLIDPLKRLQNISILFGLFLKSIQNKRFVSNFAHIRSILKKLSFKMVFSLLQKYKEVSGTFLR